MKFEWHAKKAISNTRKHGVTFEEAKTVFFDPLGFTVFDPDHSEQEDRYVTMGMTDRYRLVIVSHTDRGESVRIISARLPDPQETQEYENERLG